MKLLVTIIIFIAFAGGSVKAQKNWDAFNISNYKHDISISVTNNSHAYAMLSDYGKITHSAGNPIYLFQGQEWDNVLGVYFFPSRIYSPIEKRFYQPDPKSQYHSPYLFVGADPVNIIDIDGKKGKPLILYSENHAEPFDSGENAAIHDLQSEVADAYYVPLSKFLNGEVGDLSEWNANVFILDHTADFGEYNMTVENAEYIEDIRTNEKSPAKLFKSESDEFSVRVRPEDVGKKIRELADRQDIDVQNITAGGCEGSNAAKRIGEGYVSGGKELKGKSLSTQGLKKGNISSISGKYGTFQEGEIIFPLERTRLDIAPKESTSRLRLIEEEEGGYRVRGVKHILPDGSKATTHTFQGNQISNFVNGRTPEFAPLDVFHFVY